MQYCLLAGARVARRKCKPKRQALTVGREERAAAVVGEGPQCAENDQSAWQSKGLEGPGVRGASPCRRAPAVAAGAPAE